jgi:HEAT repeat protein
MVPALIEILARDTDQGNRALAAEALGRIGVNARPAVKALVAALSVRHHGVRIHAARALGQFEDEAAAAVPRLLDLLNDPQSPQVREAAAEALALIDADAAAGAGL